MRAHLARDVKAKCAVKKMETAVILGGLTPYLQAGVIDIFCSFNERLSPLVDEWKRSDRVSYTRGGKPCPPSAYDVVS